MDYREALEALAETLLDIVGQQLEAAEAAEVVLEAPGAKYKYITKVQILLLVLHR